MNGHEILEWLTAHGVTWERHGDRLAFDGPPHVMTPGLVARLAANKEEILWELDVRRAVRERDERDHPENGVDLGGGFRAWVGDEDASLVAAMAWAEREDAKASAATGEEPFGREGEYEDFGEGAAA
jgi:hypothetical protein